MIVLHRLGLEPTFALPVVFPGSYEKYTPACVSRSCYGERCLLPMRGCPENSGVVSDKV